MKIYQWDEIGGELHDVTLRMHEVAFSWEGWSLDTEASTPECRVYRLRRNGAIGLEFSAPDDTTAEQIVERTWNRISQSYWTK